MKNNNDKYPMWCMKCGAKHGNVPASNPDPKCKKCDGPLDFEPKKVEK